MTDQTEPDSQAFSIEASCFCGATCYKVEGKPIFSVYCHCTRCQRIHASPFVHVLHYHSQYFTWTHTDSNAKFTESEPDSPWRQWRCRKCLGLIGSENPTRGRWSLRGAHFRRNEEGLIEDWHLVKPTDHIFYGTKMLDVNDKLPKWEGFTGGSRRLDLDVKD